jgi:hypothetical protein
MYLQSPGKATKLDDLQPAASAQLRVTRDLERTCLGRLFARTGVADFWWGARRWRITTTSLLYLRALAELNSS